MTGSRSVTRSRRGLGLLVLLVLVLVLGAGVVLRPAQGERPLELIFLDVGQGDATLIRTPGGRTALVDGGRSGTRLVELLGQLGVEQLDLVVATHADFDHIGGLDHAIDDFPPAFFLDNALPHTTKAYEDLLVAVERSEARYLEPTNRTISLGEATLTVLPPPGIADEQNDNSVGILLRYGGFEALLPGDATAAEQAWWLETYPDLTGDLDVYKAAHHGSSTGDRPDFLRSLAPEVVVISAGADNSYGHPHRESLQTYQEVGARVYRTDRQGSISLLVPSGGRVGFTARTGELQPPRDLDLWAVVESLLGQLFGP